MLPGAKSCFIGRVWELLLDQLFTSYLMFDASLVAAEEGLHLFRHRASARRLRELRQLARSRPELGLELEVLKPLSFVVSQNFVA